MYFFSCDGKIEFSLVSHDSSEIILVLIWCKHLFLFSVVFDLFYASLLNKNTKS